MRRRRALVLASGAVMGVSLAWGMVLFLGWRAVRASVRQEAAVGFDLQTAGYVGSAACRACHPEHHASWARTFHRTMTADVGPGTAAAASVKAPFDGRPYRYGPVTARPFRDEAGRFWMTFTSDDAPAQPRTVEVTRAVGSHRVQQYFAREGTSWFRLPMAYHVQEGRWLHMNGAFLTADPEPTAEPTPRDGEGLAQDAWGPLPAFGGAFRAYDRHVTRWNDNCIFCHNVRPNPGWESATADFHSTTAELGIACESCHGPGGEHVTRNRNPLRRYGLRATGSPDPTIVNPSRLSPGRAGDVCGRCHGQRMTDDVGRFLAQGDPFVAGEDLGLYSAPLWAHTSLAGEPHVFAPRFWEDGTPRLSAYEYQGWLQSPCSQRGALSCIGCHGMHDGEPAGQLRPAARGDGVCRGCHAALPDALAAGTHAGSAHAKVACVDCHMPRIVYGVIDVLRSHRIEVPEPAQASAAGRPDACRLCHVSQDASWATRERGRMKRERERERDNESANQVERRSPSSSMMALALGGDPVSRAVAVAALGRLDQATAPTEARLAVLQLVMRADRYPAVRRIAARSAARLAPLQSPLLRAFDPTGPAVERERALDAWVAALPALAGGRAAGLVVTWAGEPTSLRRGADEAALDIGE